MSRQFYTLVVFLWYSTSIVGAEEDISWICSWIWIQFWETLFGQHKLDEPKVLWKFLKTLRGVAAAFLLFMNGETTMLSSLHQTIFNPTTRIPNSSSSSSQKIRMAISRKREIRWWQNNRSFGAVSDYLRGSHSLSAWRAQRTKSSRLKGPQTRSWGPEGH